MSIASPLIHGNAAHPDFDGHIARDVSRMSDGERLRLAWEGTLLLHWARKAKILDPLADGPTKPEL